MVRTFIILSLLIVSSPGTWSDICAMTASDKEEYERRGLSQVEWEMVLDSRMPMEKLDELLKTGISVSEYFRYPWLKYGITEKEWLRSRRSGLLESDIGQENRYGEKPEGAIIISAFLLPGYHQFKQKCYWKGALMAGGSVFAITYMTARSVRANSFVPHPLLLLGPAMLWSSFDVGLKIMHERNPEASRFSWDIGFEDGLRLSLLIQPR